MERSQTERAGRWEMLRKAIVYGDRFGVIDGKMGEFKGVGAPGKKTAADLEKEIDAVWTFFGPHVELLTAGAHAAVDTTSATEFAFDDDAREESVARKQEHDILLEEIEAELVRAYPGQKAENKAAKAAIISTVFDTGSWTKVQSMTNKELRSGLEAIREHLAQRDEAKE